jgi:hypothetical protein
LCLKDGKYGGRAVALPPYYTAMLSVILLLETLSLAEKVFYNLYAKEPTYIKIRQIRRIKTRGICLVL